MRDRNSIEEGISSVVKAGSEGELEKALGILEVLGKWLTIIINYIVEEIEIMNVWWNLKYFEIKEVGCLN